MIAAPVRSFSPSPQQAAFLTALETGDSHLLLSARAGTGKSTTCREGAWSLGRRRSLYCCFNKAIAADFQRDLPRTCRAATMHSLGFRMLKSRSWGVELDADGEKVDAAARVYFPHDHQGRERNVVAQLVSACKNRLIPGDDLEAVDALADELGLEIRADAREIAVGAVEGVLTACVENPHVVDFDDMVWLPVRLGAANPSPPDVLFIDEAQDLNLCQHALIDLINPDGRNVGVGDPWQSIYRFRGADSDSIPRLAYRLDACNSGRGLESFPLTVTRRCPRAVVALANKIVPDLEAAPNAPDGLVETIDAEEWRLAASAGSMILCRTNAPLVRACYALWRRRRPAHIQGRDIGKGLLAFIAARKASSVEDLLAKIDDHQAGERERMAKRRVPNADAIRNLIDKCDCVRALAVDASSIDDIRRRVETMFADADDPNAITLSSIHRSKGLERSHVLILRPDLIPGPWARTEEDRRQERNLAYVAVTRAKQRLTFCGDLPNVFR